MPIKDCQVDGKPGKKWGDSGKCYTYNPKSKQSKKDAIKKAAKQGYAIDPKKFQQEVKADTELLNMLDVSNLTKAGIIMEIVSQLPPPKGGGLRKGYLNSRVD